MNDQRASSASSSLIQQLFRLRHMLRATRRDRNALRHYGPTAPRYAECLVVRTELVVQELLLPISRSSTGLVTAQDWKPQTRSILNNPKIEYCLRRWRDGLDWESAGAVDYHMRMIEKNGSIDHCRTRADVLRRLDNLDQVWAIVVKEQRLRRAELTRWPSFREYGGVLMHLGPHAEPIFGGGGQHRLGIAIAAGLNKIPCQIGVVHPGAINLLDTLRPSGRPIGLPIPEL